MHSAEELVEFFEECHVAHQAGKLSESCVVIIEKASESEHPTVHTRVNERGWSCRMTIPDSDGHLHIYCKDGERVERLEEAVGVDPEPDLPKFDDLQMVEKVDEVYHLTVYRDEGGDCWIEDSAGEAYCFTNGVSGTRMRDAIEEANR